MYDLYINNTNVKRLSAEKAFIFDLI